MEYFAGVKTISNAFRTAFNFSSSHRGLARRYGEPAQSYEIEDDPESQNMLGALGFAYAVSLALRVIPKVTWLLLYGLEFHSYEAGLCWFAPVCSTWVWINRQATCLKSARALRSTSGRSAANPAGNWRAVPCVADAMLIRIDWWFMLDPWTN